MNEWRGDLDDDCVLERYGYMAHVEKMDFGVWWFSITKSNPNPPPFFTDIYNSANQNEVITLKNGEQARKAAEHCLELVAQHQIVNEPTRNK